MSGLIYQQNNKIKLSDKVRKFIDKALNGGDDDSLIELVKDYSNPANYNIGMDLDTSASLAFFREVPSMLKDPIIQSSLSLTMDNAFQSNEKQEVFWVNSVYPVIKESLDEFHKSINAQDFLLTEGYNELLWGNLPLHNIFDSEGKLTRVIPVPDFTKINPIVVSGKVIGYMVGSEFHYPYEYEYAQLKYYKNLGGIYKNNFVTLSTAGSEGAMDMQNEFVLAPSYLSTIAKPWRNISIIEDALLLNRMDQSNYYRIFSVNVGTNVYSKPAIKVLNYYRNLFKKVRRISYDNSGMAAKGNSSDFEVVIPTNGEQGVKIDHVGGEVDVKALKDLDTQYNRMFAGLRVQPSMIGFSSDVPNTLGSSPVTVWDQRHAKLCKALVYSALAPMKAIDTIYLRSIGYDVDADDWSYGTVSASITDDQQRADALKTSINNLKDLTDRFNSLQITDYDKNYLVESMLGSSLEAIGVDVKRLLKEETNTQIKKLNSNTSFMNIDKKDTYKVLSDIGIFNDSEYKEICSSIDDGARENSKELLTATFKSGGPVTYAQFDSGNVVYPADTVIDLSAMVHVYHDTAENVISDMDKLAIHAESMVTASINFPVIIPNDIKVTAGDLQRGSIQAISSAYVRSDGKLILTSKADLINYLYQYQSQLRSCIVTKYIEVR